MEKKKIPVNLKTVTSLLCALVALFSLIAFAASEPGAMIDFRNGLIDQTKSSITYNEETIASCQGQIATYNQDIVTLQEQIPELTAALDAATEEVTAAKAALNQAESALDQVCTRSYYSSWSCNADCRSLHNNVSSKKNAVEAANDHVKDCQEAITQNEQQVKDLEEEIKNNEDRIADCQANIEELKEELAELRGLLAGDWFGLIFKILGIILGIGGLGLFAKILLGNEEDKKFQLIACGAVAASALVFFIATAIESVIWQSAPLLYILLNPYSYTMLIMAMFAGVILEKAQKPVVFRTVAIVAAVIAVLVSATIGNVFVCFVFAAAMICLAFVIVPLVFTEYINIAKHIFLSFITLGIWQLVWIYHVTKNLNKVSGVVARTPRNELLLSMFLPFFYPYWLFKTAEYVEAYGQEKGQKIELEILAIAFAFVCPLFATVLIQNKINVLASKPE